MGVFNNKKKKLYIRLVKYFQNIYFFFRKAYLELKNGLSNENRLTKFESVFLFYKFHAKLKLDR